METKIYDLTNNDEYEIGLIEAAKAIQSGGIVVFPTETVYGLGADARNEDAVAKIFVAKGRPSDNPLIVHIARQEEISTLSDDISEEMRKCASEFMPGPFTAISKKKNEISSLVTAGLDSVGVRIPSCKFARDFILRANVPIAAPSANISGKPSPTKAQHVIDDMNGKVDVILLGEDCEIGVESTVVDFSGNVVKVLRPGAVSISQIAIVLGKKEDEIMHKFSDEKPASPGMKYKHYKPNARVIVLEGENDSVVDYINSSDADNVTTAVSCYDEVIGEIKFANKFSLGSQEDYSQAARALFAHFRNCDKMQIRTIYIMSAEKGGIADAYLNRLHKAADEVISLDGRTKD